MNSCVSVNERRDKVHIELMSSNDNLHKVTDLW